MKTEDEIIQELVEQGSHKEGDMESHTYQIVFNTLSKEPTSIISPQFANKVIQQITRLKEERAVRKDFIWLGIGLFMFLVATAITMVLTNFKFSYGAFKFLSNYGGLLLFGAVLILVLHLIEKRFFPQKTI